MAGPFCWGFVQLGSAVGAASDPPRVAPRPRPIEPQSQLIDSIRMLPTSERADDVMKIDPLDLTCTAQSSGRETGIDNSDNSTGADPGEQAVAGFSGFDGTGVPGEEPHRCDICGKTFAVPARLTRHYRTHTGERPFVCDLCGKSFSVKENLSVHRRIHTKEKPYCCTHCGRGFEHSGKLHRHMRIHTGERPHQCTDCGKTFIQSGQLVIHMRSHTGEKPYVCNVCRKGFTCSKQLKVHSRTHTGERPYACDICGKTFAYNHVLKLHQMAHLGERLYKCTLCSETYSSKKALEGHIKSHSSPNPRISPVPSTSNRAVSAPDNRHEQPVRTSRQLTSGGSFVDRSFLSGATITPSISIDLNSRSPSSAESSRSSISDADSIAGPSNVEFHPPAKASWMHLERLERLEPPPMLPINAIQPSQLLAVNRSRSSMAAELNGLRHQSGPVHHADIRTSMFLRPMPPLVPMTSVRFMAGASEPMAVPRVRESELHPPSRIRPNPSPPDVDLTINGDNCAVPPRKSHRFRHGNGDGSSSSDSSRENSPHSPATCSPPKVRAAKDGYIRSLDGSLHPAGQSVRSTSVIRFAHRPSSSSSPQ